MDTATTSIGGRADMRKLSSRSSFSKSSCPSALLFSPPSKQPTPRSRRLRSGSLQPLRSLSSVLAAALRLLLLIPPLVRCRLLVNPPSLSDTDDMILTMQNCGGFGEMLTNGEKCGVCGDPFMNDKFIVDRSWTTKSKWQANTTQVVEISMQRFRPGWFEFRLCRLNDQHSKGRSRVHVDQSCFNRIMLNIFDVNSTRLYLDPASVDKANRVYAVSLEIPSYVRCDKCLLQLRYRASDSFGMDHERDMTCLGCGPQQIFQDCSLVSVVGRNNAANTGYLNIDRISQPPDYTKLEYRPDSSLPSSRNVGQLSASNRYYEDQGSSNHRRQNYERRARHQPLIMTSNNRQQTESMLPSWMIPASRGRHERPPPSPEQYQPDRICMSREHYETFQDTVNYIEYLIHKIKHESTRELRLLSDPYYREPDNYEHRRQADEESAVPRPEHKYLRNPSRQPQLAWTKRSKKGRLTGLTAENENGRSLSAVNHRQSSLPSKLNEQRSNFVEAVSSRQEEEEEEEEEGEEEDNVSHRRRSRSRSRLTPSKLDPLRSGLLPSRHQSRFQQQQQQQQQPQQQQALTSKRQRTSAEVHRKAVSSAPSSLDSRARRSRRSRRKYRNCRAKMNSNDVKLDQFCENACNRGICSRNCLCSLVNYKTSLPASST